MKRTGSASCLLRPKHSLSQTDLQRLARDPPTATLLTLHKLPSYNADRLYIQSELQVHSTLHRLEDIHPKSVTSHVILYILWDESTVVTPLSFVQDVLSERIRQCLLLYGEHVDEEELELSKSNPLSHFSPRRQVVSVSSGEEGVYSPSPSWDEMEKREQCLRIYVVVDKIASLGGDLKSTDESEDEHCNRTHESNICNTESIHCNTNNDTQQKQLDQQQQHNQEIKAAESLARAVASSRFLRNRIDGLSIGITSDSRAAPGLEACMDAVIQSSQERRVACTRNIVTMVKQDCNDECLQNQSPEKSPISIIVCHPDDLEFHHHHNHGNNNIPLLQSRITIEWNGKGDYHTFAERAMKDWRRIWSVIDSGKRWSGMKEFSKLRRKRRRNDTEEEVGFEEPISTVMVVVFVMGVGWYIWKCYWDYLYSLAFCDWKSN